MTYSSREFFELAVLSSGGLHRGICFVAVRQESTFKETGKEPVPENAMKATLQRRLLRVAASLGVVSGIVASCVAIPHVHIASAVLVLLLGILIISDRWGFVEAAAATGLGALLLDYFLLPPRGWGLEDPQYWLVFLTFLIVALVASYAVARARRQAVELKRLYTFGQELLLEDSGGSIAAKSLDSLVRIFQLEGAAFCDAATHEITCSGPKGAVVSSDLRRHAGSQAAVSTDKDTDSLLISLRCGDQLVGSLAVCGMSADTLGAVADRIETGLEKVRAQGEARHAEETRRQQELKTALLDSLVHEIKTPLSVIKTAASSLLSRDSDVAGRRELLAIINEEADRMDASISEAFWTARVEAGILESGKGPHEIEPLIDEALNELRHLVGNRSVGVKASDSLPPANCDSHMIKAVLKELLTNAAKYSPSDSPLVISVRQTGDEIITSVADFGSGIKPGEERKIFEKHYRGSVRAPGTGLGLAIAKTIVEAHGGRIGVESQAGAGSVLYFSLPVCHRDAA